MCCHSHTLVLRIMEAGTDIAHLHKTCSVYEVFMATCTAPEVLLRTANICSEAMRVPQDGK